MSLYLAFFKPYEVLSQFSDHRGRATLAAYISIPGVYPAGRLDYRSEGLLLLSDDGRFIQRVTDPRFDHPKTYLAQVEGIATNQDLQPLRDSLLLPKLQTQPIAAEVIQKPDLPPRSKPVRPYHPTTWVKLMLQEGKKHQVRRLTASVGFPTLRLVRVAVGPVTLINLQPGEWRWLEQDEIDYFFG
jgi:23S rRNA pseudouridine2457 synthase